jgi:glycine oxidase
LTTVIGAGVAGLCVAQELVSRGKQARVIDKQATPGPGSCSWWAGGMLAPFCEAESAEPEVASLGQGAASWWQKHTGLVQQNGTLVVALKRDNAELRRFARRTQGHREIQAPLIAQLEPDLAEKFQRGLFYPDEAHLSPRDAVLALRDNLQRAGVEFITDEVDPKAIARTGITVDCRGIGAKADLPQLRGVKGEMLILHCPDVSLTRPIRLLHPRIPLYIVPRREHQFMLGATMIESSAKTRVSARSLLELLSAAYALNPAFGEAEVLEIGVDSRPAFETNLPQISHYLPKISHHGQLITANGLYRHGFLLAPSLATMVADLICQNKQPQWLQHE